ncbi:MAG: nitroreductase family protein [Chloroflexota bacterium]|nr:nitroreductase family protein [Chloroflexota bacterium]
MDVKQAIQTRRAYRSLEQAKITEDIIRDLAKSAQLTPSCFNNQPWRFVFVYESKKLAEVQGALSRGNAWAKNGSMIVAVFSEQELDCTIKERVYFQFDTGMATAFMMLRATELGLVAHPIAGYKEETVKEILNIPDEMQVITMLVVGKFAECTEQAKEERERPERLGLDKFTFMNSYAENT